MGAPTEAKRVGSILALWSNCTALVRKQTRETLVKEIESSVFFFFYKETSSFSEIHKIQCGRIDG